MLQIRSRINVADNSGAKEVELVGIPGKGNVTIAHVGDVIRCVVKKASSVGSVKNHEKVLAVVVRTRKQINRKDGSSICFDDNAVVVLENVVDKLPKGTRIFGPIAREIKEMGYNKIASMAAEVY